MDGSGTINPAALNASGTYSHLSAASSGGLPVEFSYASRDMDVDYKTRVISSRREDRGD